MSFWLEQKLRQQRQQQIEEKPAPENPKEQTVPIATDGESNNAEESDE